MASLKDIQVITAKMEERMERIARKQIIWTVGAMIAFAGLCFAGVKYLN